MLASVSSGSSHEISGYMRVGSLAVAFYDYLQTLPFEYRMWRRAWKGRQLTYIYSLLAPLRVLTVFYANRLSFTLFLLIRYASILVLVVSNFGFFYPGFTEESCQRYFLTPSIFKGFPIFGIDRPQLLTYYGKVNQVMISQAILGFRAYNLSRKSARFAYGLFFLFILASTLEWLATLHNRKEQFSEEFGNCSSSSPRSLWGGWAHYAVAIVYDFIITVICIFFLLKLKTSKGSVMSRVTKMMLVDGIWYFIGLALVNFLNLGFYRATPLEVQTAAASLGYCVTWIMSQRLLIHLHGDPPHVMPSAELTTALEASVDRRNESIDAAVTITQHLASARDVSRALRSQFESKSGAGFDLTVPDFDLEALSRTGDEEDKDAEVHVRIERTVRMERTPRVYELEDYSRTARSTITSRSKH
ncbi:hypothetical protein MSAN_00007800 [Mycena sanguinolenta]|uniref:Uncharacterized protein n=1 Tax=Mycena sanguinolenta TaxID=230812 RepID=A0A8H6ZDY9_9AGAR|nr:hypothetical protein MSAN_00007800 [Mycena sanguinolenta]